MSAEQVKDQIGSDLIDGYLCWPFTTKGHFHLPSGIAPVLMDVEARYHKGIGGKDFLYLPYSWNVTGRPITDRALMNITGMTRDELHKDNELYVQLIGDNLEEILRESASLAQQSSDKSKSLMTPLGLMDSGLYSGENVIPFEFRDDAEDYKSYIQQKFLGWYESGIAYMQFKNGKPTFYLNIGKLYAEKPLGELINGLNVRGEVIREFRNNYQIYKADLPISTVGGYGTPAPLYVDGYGNIQIADGGSESVDPRINSDNKNHLLIIKPLVNCYLFAEYLAKKFHGFGSVDIANDYHMATRINFVSSLLSERNYQAMNLYIFNLLTDANGRIFSFKNGVIQSIRELDDRVKGLARFTIIKNTRLGYGHSELNVDSHTFDRVRKILEEDKEWQEGDKIFSKMFKKEVSVSEIVARGLEKGNVSQVLNFLIDGLIQNPNNLTIRYYLRLFL